MLTLRLYSSSPPSCQQPACGLHGFLVITSEFSHCPNEVSCLPYSFTPIQYVSCQEMYCVEMESLWRGRRGRKQQPSRGTLQADGWCDFCFLFLDHKAVKEKSRKNKCCPDLLHFLSFSLYKETEKQTRRQKLIKSKALKCSPPDT